MEHQTESGPTDRPEDAQTPEQPGAGASSEATQENSQQKPSASFGADEAASETMSSAEAASSQDANGSLLENTAWMQEVDAYITEPPQGEDEDEFALIPAGPVEEVNYDEGRPRGARIRRSARGRRPDHRRPAHPAPVAAAPAQAPRRDRFPLWAAIAAAIILVLLGLLTLWIISRYRSAAKENMNAHPAPPAVSSSMEESGYVL